MGVVEAEMDSNRIKVLLGIAMALAAVLVWNWIAGWGLVTVDVDGVALQKVIRSIERQGGVTVVSGIDPETSVSMEVYRVPVAEAMEVLAARLDADWSVIYAAGPAKADAKNAAAALASSSIRDSGLKMFRGGGGGFMDFGGEAVPDPRLVQWNVSAMDTAELQGYADQFSQKTGASIVLPESWNPVVKGTPKSGEAGKAIQKLFSSVGGASSEVFYLRESGGWRGGPPATAGQEGNGNAATTAAAGGNGQRPGGERPDRGEGGDRGNRPEPNREWMAERAEAQIAMLPKDEQNEAREDYKKVREFFEEVRKLPDEERRAKMQEFFDDPKVQARMDERRSLREDRAGPEKKADRARRYVERKEQRKNS